MMVHVKQSVLRFQPNEDLRAGLDKHAYYKCMKRISCREFWFVISLSLHLLSCDAKWRILRLWRVATHQDTVGYRVTMGSFISFVASRRVDSDRRVHVLDWFLFYFLFLFFIGSVLVAVFAGAVVCNGIICIYIYIYCAHVFNGNVDQWNLAKITYMLYLYIFIYKYKLYIYLYAIYIYIFMC